MIEGIDYYIDKDTGLMVLTALFLQKRGYCCGKKCRECPYDPPYQKGNKQLINKDRQIHNSSPYFYMGINFYDKMNQMKKRKKKQKKRIMPGFEKFQLYGFKLKKVTQNINTKK